MDSNKNDTKELFHKTETNLFISKPILLLPYHTVGQEGGLRTMGITLHCIKYIINKNLGYHIGKSTSLYVITSMGNIMNICITESLCCTPETNTL